MALTALIVFIAYITIAIKQFGIPESISNTFYLYNEKRNGLGYVFTLFMWTVGSLMIMPMITLGDGHWWQFVGFLCPTALCFCGAAPMFKDTKMESSVHVIGAVSAAILGLLWCFLAVGYHTILPVLITMVSLVIAMGKLTETLMSCKTFWLEIAGFGTIGIVLNIAVFTML